MKTKLMAAMATGALMLAGCGGGGDGTSVMVDPAGSPLSFVDLVQGEIVEAGTYHLVGASDAFLEALEDVVVPADGYEPDSMITIAGVSFRCTADNASNCNIAVHDDRSFTTVGTIATVLSGAEFPMTDAERVILAERARAEAEKARADAAEAARQQAEAERQRLEDEREKAQQEANAARAALALQGFASTTLDALALTVTRSYRDVAVNAAGATFTSESTSSSGRWFITSLSGGDDEMVVYSDVGPQSSEKMFDHRATYTGLFNEDGTLTDAGLVVPASPTYRIASSSFKKNMVNSFPVDDRDNDPATTETTVRISGTLDGASGHFVCTSTTACTVSNTGGDSYAFAGDAWAFHPTSQNATIKVDDDSHMHFGWWKREVTGATPSISYRAFQGGTFAATDATTATGSATYSGPAIGHYAVHQPAGVLEGAGVVSGHGSFTAEAELTANFDANSLSGTISNFSHASNWSLTLQSAAITGSGVSDGDVEWSIGQRVGTAGTDDSWNATFYRDVSTGTAQPEGVAGTFEATYGDVARMIGAFGAHRPQ